MSENKILFESGNSLAAAYRKKLITCEEYKEYCQLIHIEEYDTPEEAKNREVELIVEYKEKHGSLCLNQSFGNKYGGITGAHHSKETRKKISEAHKGMKKPWAAEVGRHHSKPVFQFTKEGQFVAEYSSIVEASRQTGIDKGSISHCLTGWSKLAGGFIWRYKATNSL